MTVLAEAKPCVTTQTARPEPVEGLAPGWARVSITEISHSMGGGTPSKSDASYWTAGTVPWVSPKDMKSFHIISSEDAVTESALKQLSVIPTNSVLLVVRSGILSHTLPVGLNALPVTINQDMRAFVAAREISARYLAWQLVSRGREILSACSKDGTTVASIEAPALARFPLTLAPAAEQTRIVEKLEELLSDLDAGVAELKAAQKKLTQYRQSLLKAAVEGVLTADWRGQRTVATPSSRGRGTGRGYRLNAPSPLSPHPLPNPPPQREGTCETGAQLLERILKERRVRWQAKQLAKFKEQGKAPPKDWQHKYPEPVKPDTTDLPPLPEGWVWASAEQLCDFITKGTTPPKEFDGSGEKVIPFLRVTNLSDGGEMNMNDKVFVSKSTHDGFLARSAVYPGDVLMNIVGPPLGQVSVVPATFPEWNINQAIAIFRAVDGVLPSYVCLNLLSPLAQYWLKARAKTTAGQSNLTLETCRSLPIPLPSEAEQQALVQAADVAINAIDGQVRAIQHALKHSDAQRKNILKAAFSGQLVPQDPNDEPASVLLTRIRAERAAGAATAKAPKPKKIAV